MHTAVSVACLLLVILCNSVCGYTMAPGISASDAGTVAKYVVFENQTDLGVDYGKLSL